MRFLTPALLLLAALLAGCAHPPRAESPAAVDRADANPAMVELAIVDTTVVDVRSGALLAHRDVSVDHGRIVAIEPAGAASARRTVDGAGRFLIPGLWDMHVHFGGGEALVDENRDLLPLYVAHGVTTVRDAAGDLSGHVLQWRDQIARGELQGPTLYTSGPKIEGKGSIWPGDLEVANQAELDAALDQLQALHVDFVKITDNALPTPLFEAALRGARRRGMVTSAHIPMSLSLDAVAADGLGSIEHMGYALKSGSPREDEISARSADGTLAYRDALTLAADTFDETRALAAYRRLAAHGTAITPTLYGSRVTAYLDQVDHRGDDFLAYIGPGLKATYNWRVERAARDDAAAIAARHRVYERSASLLPLLQRAGVTVLIGTDVGFLNSYNYPGIGLHDEMREYVRYGLTPLQTLQSATLRNAGFLGHGDESGEIAVGKVADLVLLDADPLQDIEATRRIQAVVLKGDYLDRAALDALLEQVRARTAQREATYRAQPPAP
ncbi:amidohydrolase family protein [Agrilutibacter solisilvae]|uniref:Amidohydrolase family protein n=1 Tax=Agrilutibacter solisilvae TaxID=2763317 RepID=A0A974XW65_9GAMM|nr:amidohydrolase family protein [Lysobacter solisilvae]QSX76997.1 amidohydrolase family protein [Lysobacter solisilvae]